MHTDRPVEWPARVDLCVERAAESTLLASELGVLYLLARAMWEHPLRACQLPTDLSQLEAVAARYRVSPDAVRAAWPGIRHLWTVSEDGAWMWLPRLREEWERLHRLRDRQRHAAAATNRARWAAGPPDVGELSGSPGRSSDRSTDRYTDRSTDRSSDRRRVPPHTPPSSGSTPSPSDGPTEKEKPSGEFCARLDERTGTVSQEMDRASASHHETWSRELLNSATFPWHPSKPTLHPRVVESVAKAGGLGDPARVAWVLESAQADGRDWDARGRLGDPPNPAGYVLRRLVQEPLIWAPPAWWREQWSRRPDVQARTAALRVARDLAVRRVAQRLGVGLASEAV